MPVKCCVSLCKLQTDDPNIAGVSFHKLPAREGIREEWLKILKTHSTLIHPKYTYVCSQHFERECFQYTGLCKRRMLKNGSVPTIFHDIEIVNCSEQHSIITPKLETQDDFDSSAPCDPFPLTNEDIVALQQENEHLKKLFKVETDCQSTSESVEIHSTDANSDIVREWNPSENTDSNNAGNDQQTMTEKRLRNKIATLQRRNRNLTGKLDRCRKKMYRFKVLFETLRRQKSISHNKKASLGVGISISK